MIHHHHHHQHHHRHLHHRRHHHHHHHHHHDSPLLRLSPLDTDVGNHLRENAALPEWILFAVFFFILYSCVFNRNLYEIHICIYIKSVIFLILLYFYEIYHFNNLKVTFDNFQVFNV